MIYLRYSHAGKIAYFGCGVHIAPEHFEPVKVFAPRCPDKARHRQDFDSVFDRLRHVIRTLQESGIDPSIEAVRHEFNKQPEPVSAAVTFGQVWGEYYSALQTGGTKTGTPAAPGTLDQARSVWKILAPLCDDDDVMTMNRDYWHSLRAKLAPGRGAARLSNIFAMIRAALRYAEAKGTAVHPAFRSIQTKAVRRSYVALSESELKLFAAVPTEGTEQLARDAFLIACHCGLRINDVLRIAPANIDGGNIRMMTTKRRKLAVIPILPIVREILDRYANHAPKIHRATIGLMIKRIAERAGITQPIEVEIHGSEGVTRRTVRKCDALTVHSAVKTFIRLCFSRGIPAERVAAVTGRSVKILFNHYHEAEADREAEKMRDSFRDFGE